MKKIRKGDHVIIIAGKDKGRDGKVLSVLPEKVVVEGVNVVKKHVKTNPAKEETGGIVVKNMPIAISNVAIFNPKTKKADRVGIRLIEEEGKKVRRERFYKSDGEAIQAS